MPFVLLQWGFDWQDVADQFRIAFFGFQVGETRISVISVIAALLVFVLGYILAKVFQGWLDSQVLEPAGVEGSVRHSIRLIVGYLGIAVAAVAAVSYAGLDISNLALIAGALSVGIGFGLQSVVNNFVSGLILLAERRIRPSSLSATPTRSRSATGSSSAAMRDLSAASASAPPRSRPSSAPTSSCPMPCSSPRR